MECLSIVLSTGASEERGSFSQGLVTARSHITGHACMVGTPLWSCARQHVLMTVPVLHLPSPKSHPAKPSSPPDWPRLFPREVVRTSNTLPWSDTSNKPPAILHLSSSPTQLFPALLHMEPRCCLHGGLDKCSWAEPCQSHSTDGNNATYTCPAWGPPVWGQRWREAAAGSLRPRPPGGARAPRRATGRHGAADYLRPRR